MTDEPKNLGLRYRIDASRSEFTVQAFSEGMLSFMGHNPTFAVRRYGGEVQFASGNQIVDSMLLVIETETLTLLDRVKEKTRRKSKTRCSTTCWKRAIFQKSFLSVKTLKCGR